jgi:hypothetical protein
LIGAKEIYFTKRKGGGAEMCILIYSNQRPIDNLLFVLFDPCKAREEIAISYRIDKRLKIP